METTTDRSAMSTLNEFYAGHEVQCPHCYTWAPAVEFDLVGEEGFECPVCEIVDTGSIPLTRKPVAARGRRGVARSDGVA